MLPSSDTWSDVRNIFGGFFFTCLKISMYIFHYDENVDDVHHLQVHSLTVGISNNVCHVAKRHETAFPWLLLFTATGSKYQNLDDMCHDSKGR